MLSSALSSSVRSILRHCLGSSGCSRAIIRSLNSNMATLETINFDNRALRTLPIDPSKENHPRQVRGACFSLVDPMPLANPKTVAYSAAAFELIDLPESELRRDEFAEYFSGNQQIPGSKTAAHCYCGHQFGYFAGQLGDGATMYIGEVVNRKGDRWEIQFKGAGKTPYSRTADGRKVLRSSIREFLCSEAMHYLGIPTTRAGCCVTSDTRIERDINYDGNSILEKCTVILRLAPTFLRFGSFEVVLPMSPESGRKGPSDGMKDITEKLLQYTIGGFFPQILEAHPDSLEDQSLALLVEVVQLTAQLVANWQCVGFCHGVLNTDNMSILGLTIDYGPFGFLDAFDADHICNASDNNGRYSYRNQPEMCKWNLNKFAEAIKMVLPLELSKPVIDKFDEHFKRCYLQKMRRKLGLMKEEPQDEKLVASFLDVLQEVCGDFTNSFRCLSSLPLPSCENFQEGFDSVLDELVAQGASAEELRKYNKPTMHPRELQMIMVLMQSNPEAAEIMFGGSSKFKKQIERMKRTEEIRDLTDEDKKNTDREKWKHWLDEYSSRLGHECEGLSKTELEALNKERVTIMNSSNPKFILRNYIAQNAIEAAENGDYSEVHRVLRLLQTPYSDDIDLGDLAMKPREASQPVADEQSAVASTSQEDGSPATSPDSHTPSEYHLKGITGIAYNSRPPNWAADLSVS